MSVTRRGFTKQALGSLLTISLLETLTQLDLFAGEVKPITVRWLADMNELARDVKGQKIKQQVWQAKIEALYKHVDLPDLLRGIDFDRLASKAKLPDNGAASLRFKLPEVEGVPKDLIFGRQIFALKKDRSVVPHGHNNMATAFLILKGDLQGRHYDRVKTEAEHYLIRPTINRGFGPGECSTISDFKDNVHWFKAKSDTAFIFNIHVMDVDPSNKQPASRLYLDPAGEKLADGLIRAQKLDSDECHRRYG